MISRHYVLAAGGTGGHMVPAHALAEELIARGHRVALVTDERGARIPGLFDGVQVHILPAGRLGGGPIGWLKALKNILAGRAMASRLYETFRPSAVVGFGGYPALPALLAAQRDGIPTLIHEQNAVLGRVNRLLARRVDAIATSYPDVQRLKPRHLDKVHLVGNPVRDEVLALRDQPFPALTEDGIFRVLVTGGSQGATILSSVVPDGLGMLPEHFRRRLQVTQQCRAEDIEEVRARYAGLGIPADLATYMPDLPERLAWSHLVIARAGASTIAELTVAGRPAILIPLPSATDDHQTFNAREMARSGGARMIPQLAFTPVELAKQMQKLGLEPEALANAAERAKGCGRPDAAKDLADLVERMSQTPALVGPEEVAFRPVPAGGAMA
ncbi:undecaprenyldiphospho-muramoylpentapeptide beta-N-acetylglucosaminyltransferase [Sphingosinicella humi]|uniref:UDP-N-acetylglucosamine--N-acetylmuramyl-(pentapeptide) pyrophosphoryl-undecaprenol N-acetylglucosamine transferase n=1 Tax=Allosphingosinicella humi TaxID=2068657 RepID=A0A2U2J4A0_9SPHN|nr:undecaprenyldiphospho-muramoylpentapeptide beta-N-acetylglucosaminyltransferase [Sphingosinicella humi]PWG03176.1 undecaprenyldiphospho-muramoylpentapeptide beta-N-acetylglucosaminyltransferase [Sphingosinicella humi]